MKKALSLILALVLCLSLCACNAANNEEAKIEMKDTIIGKWERKFTTSNGDEIKQVIELFKGGTGKFYIYSEDTDHMTDPSYQASWEIKDDVLNFTYGSSLTVTLGLLLDTSKNPMTLTQVDDASAVFTKTP